MSEYKLINIYYTILIENKYIILLYIYILYITFAPTVHTTLPIRTASQGVSFAFITFRNAVALPLHNAHYAALFSIIVPALHTVRSAGGSFFFVPLAQ
jgi:hypothetical protein